MSHEGHEAVVASAPSQAARGLEVPANLLRGLGIRCMRWERREQEGRAYGGTETGATRCKVGCGFT